MADVGRRKRQKKNKSSLGALCLLPEDVVTVYILPFLDLSDGCRFGQTCKEAMCILESLGWWNQFPLEVACLGFDAVSSICSRINDPINIIDFQGCVGVRDDQVCSVLEQCKFGVRQLGLNWCASLGDAILDGIPTISLQNLSIGYCNGISSFAFSLFIAKCANTLQALDIQGCHRMDNIFLAHLSEAVHLRQLYIALNDNFSDDGIKKIFEKCKNLERVMLAHCSNLTQDALQCMVENCHQIQHIEIRGSQFSDCAVQFLVQLPRLGSIVLRSCENLTTESLFLINNKIQSIKKNITTSDSTEIVKDPIKQMFSVNLERTCGIDEETKCLYCENWLMLGVEVMW